MSETAVFFDLDDTLLDHTYAQHRASLALFSEYTAYLGCTRREFLAMWERLTEESLGRFVSGQMDFQEQRRWRLRRLLEPCELCLEDAECDQVFAWYLERYEAEWRLFNDVEPCLRALGEIPLGIITNGDHQQQLHKLDRLGIRKRFLTIISASEVGLSKPDKRIFHLACKKMGIHPTQCWFVGDRITDDACGARDAGMHAVWVNRHNASMPLERGLHVLHSLSGLPKLVAKYSS